MPRAAAACAQGAGGSGLAAGMRRRCPFASSLQRPALCEPLPDPSPSPTPTPCSIGGLLLAFVGFVIGLAGLLRIFMYRDPVSD